MEVKKYNPFVVINSKPKTKTLPMAKVKPKPKTELEAKGLTLGNKKKLDNFMLKVLLRLVGNSLIIIGLVIGLVIDLFIDLVIDLVID